MNQVAKSQQGPEVARTVFIYFYFSCSYKSQVLMDDSPELLWFSRNLLTFRSKLSSLLLPSTSGKGAHTENCGIQPSDAVSYQHPRSPKIISRRSDFYRVEKVNKVHTQTSRTAWASTGLASHASYLRNGAGVLELAQATQQEFFLMWYGHKMKFCIEPGVITQQQRSCLVCEVLGLV